MKTLNPLGARPIPGPTPRTNVMIFLVLQLLFVSFGRTSSIGILCFLFETFVLRIYIHYPFIFIIIMLHSLFLCFSVVLLLLRGYYGNNNSKFIGFSLASRCWWAIIRKWWLHIQTYSHMRRRESPNDTILLWATKLGDARNMWKLTSNVLESYNYLLACTKHVKLPSQGELCCTRW